MTQSQSDRGRLRSVKAMLAAAAGILAVLGSIGLVAPGSTRAGAVTESQPRPPAAVASATRSLLGSLEPGYTVAGPAEWVRTTRRAYERLDDDRVPNPDQELYVVQVRGRFTCAACSRPYGATVQTGSAVGSGFPVHGSGGTSGRIGPPLDLSELGTVHTFAVS
jgi:hypothetical protein